MTWKPHLALVFTLFVSLVAAPDSAETADFPPRGNPDLLGTIAGKTSADESSASVRRPADRRAPLPGTVWVSAAYDAGHAGWGTTHFATIQDAIDGVNNCGSVHVAAGKYDESVLIARCVSLLGEGAEVTTVDAEGLESAVTVEETHDVRISGFTLSNASDGDGVTIVSSTDVTISDNVITGNLGDGVKVGQSERVVVRNNRVFSNELNGIRLDLTIDSEITFNVVDNEWPVFVNRSYGNLIGDNTITGHPAGISLYERSDNNRVVRNTIIDGGCTPIRCLWSSHNLYQGNTVIRGRWGIYLGYSEKSIVADNEISDVVDGDAIALYHASDCHILNNTATSPRYGGITLTGDSSRNIVQGNSLSGGWRGISVFYDSNENHIMGNQVSNVQHGVIVDAASDNLIYRNNFDGNTHQGYDNGANTWSFDGVGNYWSDHQPPDAGEDGIGDRPRRIPPQGEDPYPLSNTVEIARASVPALESTVFESEAPQQLWFDDERVWADTAVDSPGFTIGNGGRLTIQNSTVTFVGSRWRGIVVEAGATLEILDSTVQANGKEIWIKEGSTFRMEDSELISAGNWEGGGALWVTADNAIVRNNLIRDSWGIGIDSSSNDTVLAGNAIENSYEGIAIPFGHTGNVVVRDNTIRNVIKRGINFVGSSNATVTGNTVTNCWAEPIYVSTESTAQPNSFSNNAFMNYRQRPFSEGNNLWYEGDRGNYWGDYLDQYPSATCSTGDAAVWDTPFSIGTGGNEDPFPLVCPPNGTGDPVIPATPDLVSPATGSTTSSTDVELSWTPIDGATGYRIQIAISESFNEPVVNTCSITTEDYHASGFEPDTTYYWRVLALTDGCHGPWSEVWAFATGSASR